MADSELPAGRYLTCPVDVKPDYGGQTRAHLMRNRIFAAETGISPSVLTFGPATDMDERRAILLERGLITPSIDLLNIYEHYRANDWPEATPLERPLVDLSAFCTSERPLADGSPFRKTYELPDTGEVINEYLRSDASPFLRIPRFTFRDASTWPSNIQRVSRSGDLVGEYPSLSAWFQQWIRELTADAERAFVFMDSRYIAPHLASMESPDIHLVYLLHNIHLGGQRNWNSQLGDVYQRLLSHIGDMDAMVTLTDRQGEDLAQRFGRTSNLFVVPNPVDYPEEPSDEERDPNLVTVVARLEGQKRLGHVIRAFARVVTKVPEARLHIYGAGSRRDQLQGLIDEFGLTDVVTLMGHNPRAREALWRSSAFVMTSLFEGYPLSTLESMSHGCPVIAYDIKYGPREQITDGVDGFLVEEGDIQGVAERLVRLLEDPELVRKMSEAARRKARQHGRDRFISDWNDVLSAAIELKPRRTTIEGARLEVTKLRLRKDLLSRLRGFGRTPTAPGRRPHGRLDFAATLHIHGTSPTSRLSEAVVELAAVTAAGKVAPLPMTVDRLDDGFRLSAEVPLAALEPAGDDPGGEADLRLRVTWQNSSWETKFAGGVAWRQ